MIFKRKITKGRVGDDSYVVDKQKGVIRYKDPKTGSYIESKIQEGTVNIKPISKKPSLEKVKSYFKSKKEDIKNNFTREGFARNMSTLTYRTSASGFR